MPPNQNVMGVFPLHIAAMDDQPQCIKLLVERGADLYARSHWNNGGLTALEAAVISNSLKSIQALAEAGCDFSKSESADTPAIVRAVISPSLDSFHRKPFAGYDSTLVINLMSFINEIGDKRSPHSRGKKPTIEALLARRRQP